MSKVTVIDNQNLLDIAIQTTGKASNYLKIAQANNLSGTDKLEAGTVLIIPEGIEVDNEVLSYYQSKKSIPATDVDGVNIQRFKGIGEMEIGNTFIVR